LQERKQIIHKIDEDVLVVAQATMVGSALRSKFMVCPNKRDGLVPVPFAISFKLKYKELWVYYGLIISRVELWLTPTVADPPATDTPKMVPCALAELLSDFW
jgi:hypothetical protein